MNKDLITVFEYLERERGIKREIVIAAIEESLRTVAERSFHGATNLQVTISPKTGEIAVLTNKQVVEKVTTPMKEISLRDAQKLDPSVQIGASITVAITPRDFGRIAAQKARYIIAQKLRGAERDVIQEEYRHRVNELVSGAVKRISNNGTVIIDLGKVEGVLPKRNYPPTEHFSVGERVLALLHEVRDTEMGGAEVVLSRSHPEFVRQLLAQEIPEIGDGTVTIERLVRDPGYRTKVVVRSSDLKIDPVGATIGMRGSRIKNVIRELHNEKLDVIPYAQDKIEQLQLALQPIEMRHIRANEDVTHVYIVVDDESFASAIGKRGLNVRLLGDLIGARLDIQKSGDFARITAIQRADLATSDNASLDEPVNSISGVSRLVVDQLVAEGFDTYRKLLLATQEQLAAIQGISKEMVETILEQLRKQVQVHTP